MKRTELVKRYRIAGQKAFRLADINPADTWKLKSKEHAEKWLEDGVARLRELQDKLYAQKQWAVLLIFQGMDTAGKDSTIKHVMSGVDPQGCEVAAQGRYLVLNQACPAVRDGLCEAAGNVARLYRETGQAAAAEALRSQAVRQRGCLATRFR